MVSRSPELTKSVLGIAVGVGGIHATLLTDTGALDAVGAAISGTGLPPSFKSLGGAATLFVTILTAVTAVASLFLGLVWTLERVFCLARYRRPRVIAFSLVGIFFWASAMITVLMYDFIAAAAFLAVSLVMATTGAIAGMVMAER
jgi:hypothetical protein